MENAQSEPSMEEILASIRRIISEDEDDTATTAAETAPSDATEPEIEALAMSVSSSMDRSVVPWKRDACSVC